MCPVLSLLYFQKAHNKWPKVEQGAHTAKQETAGRRTGGRTGGRTARLAGEATEATALQLKVKTNELQLATPTAPSLSWSLHASLIVYLLACRPPPPLALSLDINFLAFGTFAIMHMLSHALIPSAAS